MNYIDIIIIVILLLSMVTGFINGFVRELASLAALILGIWGAIKFSTFTAAQLDGLFDMTGRYVGIVAFIITFIIIVIVIHFIGLLADRLVKIAALGFLNRLLGILFGLFKTIMILSVIMVVLNAIDARKPFLPREKISNSMLYSPISDIAPALFPIIGEGSFDQSFDRFKKKPQEITI